MTDLITALRRSLKDGHVEHRDGEDVEDTGNADYVIELEYSVAKLSTTETTIQDLGELRIPSLYLPEPSPPLQPEQNSLPPPRIPQGIPATTSSQG